MSVLFRTIVVPNLYLRYLHSGSNLLWFKNTNDLYRLGVKNEAILLN